MEFFKVTKNELNGEYMVHSECEQLVQCYAYKGKAKATTAKNELNAQALKDYKKLTELKIAPVLTWKNKPQVCK